MNGTDVNCLLSQEHLLLDTSAPSDLSFSQSSTDLPSLIDNCLMDSIAAQIDIIDSPRNMETTDDNDYHSAMSTPPLQPDSYSDVILPANGVFPAEIDNSFISQSPSNNQLVLDSFSECSKIVDCSFGDSSVISEQLDVDVNSLISNYEGEMLKVGNEKKSIEVGSSDVISEQLDMDVNSLLQGNEVEKESIADDCSAAVVDSAVGSSDVISTQLDVDVNSLISNCEGEILKVDNEKKSIEVGSSDVISEQLDMDVNNLLHGNEVEKESIADDCSAAVVDNAVGSNDVISTQLDVDVNSLLRLREGETPKSDNEKESSECVQYSRFDDVASSICDTVETLKDLTDTCDVKSETVSSLKSDLASSPNVDACYQLNCNASLPVPVQESSAKSDSHHDEELVTPPLFIVQFDEVASESQLPADSSEAKRTSQTEDVEPFLPSVVSCDSSKTDANFATGSSTVKCSDVKTEGVLLDNKGFVNNDVKMDITVPPLSDSGCRDSVKDTSNDFKPFPNITTTGVSSVNTVNTAYLGNACDTGSGLFSSEVKGTSPMPCMASFSSSNSDDWSFDESWLPDWKLQTNAVVRLKRLVLPAGQYFPLLKNTADSKEESTSNKLHSQSGLTLASVEPLLSKMTSDESQTKSKSPTPVPSKTTSYELETESKSPTTTLADKGSPVLSERSSFSALIEDMPTKQPEQAKMINKQPSAVTDVPPSSLSSSSLSSSGTKALSSTDVSGSSRQKRFSYAYDCKNDMFQPVVRLVRLPLEFFRMLQQTSQPMVSSSILMSDLQKRFVVLQISAADIILSCHCFKIDTL